jgi:hypothetical protein
VSRGGGKRQRKLSEFWVSNGPERGESGEEGVNEETATTKKSREDLREQSRMSSTRRRAVGIFSTDGIAGPHLAAAAL